MDTVNQTIAEFLDRLRQSVGAKHVGVFFGDPDPGNTRFQFLGIGNADCATLLERMAWLVRTGQLECSDTFAARPAAWPSSNALPGGQQPLLPSTSGASAAVRP